MKRKTIASLIALALWPALPTLAAEAETRTSNDKEAIDTERKFKDKKRRCNQRPYRT